MALRILRVACFVTEIQNVNCRYYSTRKISRIVDLLEAKQVGEVVSVQGWVKAVRKLKDIYFVDVNDGSCCNKLQIVLQKSSKPENLGYGASVEVDGTLLENANSQIELQANNFNIIGTCDVKEGYPFLGKGSHAPEYLRKFLHMRVRTRSFSSLLRIRSVVTSEINNYFHDHDYVHIHTPILTCNDCEGAGEVFVVRPNDEALVINMKNIGFPVESAFFNTKAFLTVSGQLHLEAMARGLGNVYTFGPTFRAENSRSRLHLSEFYMVEAEAAFMNNLNDLLNFLESFIKDVTKRTFDKCESDIKMLQDDDTKVNIKRLLTEPFVVMSYKDTCNILKEHLYDSKYEEGRGLNKEQELFIVKHCGNTPVFVVEWPVSCKPFYMKQIPNSLQVAAVDLLVPQVGELCGGSLREDNYSILKEKLETLGLVKDLLWYLNLRKFGNIPTAGFGLGLERYLQMLLGITNIKDTIPFPRWPHNCSM